MILARNWLKPFSKLGQTTLFRFKVGAQTYLLEDFQKDPQGIAERFQFEQHYVYEIGSRWRSILAECVGQALPACIACRVILAATFGQQPYQRVRG